MIKKWETEHTYIEGKQLEFTGDPFELFGKYIIWWVLTIITIGIYTSKIKTMGSRTHTICISKYNIIDTYRFINIYFILYVFLLYIFITLAI